MKTNKKALSIFFSFTFGMPVILGIFMGVVFFSGTGCELLSTVTTQAWLSGPFTPGILTSFQSQAYNCRNGA